MNHILCAICHNVPFLQLKNDDDIVRINCENCKKSIKKNIRLFLKENENNIYSKKSIETNFDLNVDEFPRYTINGKMNEINVSIIQNRIEKFKKIVDEKTFSLKKKYINEYINKINEIESAYEKFKERAHSYIKLINNLIDDYSNNQNNYLTFFNLSTNCDINIYEINSNSNFDELKTYFNTYIFYAQNDINSMNSIKTVQVNSAIYSMVFLNDHRLAIGCEDKKIKIFNMKNNLNLELSFQAHKKIVSSLCLLPNGTLISASFDCDIKFWSIQGENISLLHTIQSAHNDFISKVISLPNSQIALCSYDNTIKIWSSKENYSLITIINEHFDSVKSILYLKETDILLSCSIDNTLRWWRADSYECTHINDKVYCCSKNSLYQIDSERVIVGDYSKIYIINIFTYQIENFIKDEKFGNVCSFLLLRNGKILCNCDKEQQCIYDIHINSYEIKQKSHRDLVTNVIEINEHSFITSSLDSTLQIWEY